MSRSGAGALLLLAVVGVAWLVRVDGGGPRDDPTILDAGTDSGWEAVDASAFRSASGGVIVRGVEVADGTVVIVGGDARNGPEGLTGASVWRSADGGEWQRLADDRIDGGGGRFAEAATMMQDVAVVGYDGRTRLVAVGWAQTEDARVPLAWVSDDRGASWRLVEPEEVEGRLEAVTASPDGIVAVGAVQLSRGVFGASWVSADGEEWERRAVSGLDGTHLLHSVADAGGTFVAAATVGEEAPVLWASGDGRSWQPARLPEGADGRVSVVHVVAAEDGGFLAVGSTVSPGRADTDGLVLHSTNGRAWAQAAEPVGTVPGNGDQSVHDVAAGDVDLVGVGVDDGDPVVWHARHDSRWQVTARGDHRLAGAGADATAAMTRIHRIPGGLLAVGSVTDTSDRPERPIVWLHPTDEETAQRTPPAAATGLRLVASSDIRLTVADVDAGTTETIRLDELSGGDPPFRLAARGDAAIVLHGAGGGTYVVDPDRPDAPRLLGESTYFLPSADGDRVWLVDGAAGTAARNRVREITVDGEETVGATDVPSGRIPTAAVAAGIVLEPGLEVWDPDHGEIVARLPGGRLVAAGGDLLAWCEGPCSELRLTGIGGGDTALPDGVDERAVEVPPDAGEWVPHGARFGPGERHLAIAVTAVPDPFAEPGADFGLAVVDAGSGEVRVLEEASVPAGPFAWSPDGRWLFAPTSGGRILVHDVEQNRTDVRALDLGTVHGLGAVR